MKTLRTHVAFQPIGEALCLPTIDRIKRNQERTLAACGLETKSNHLQSCKRHLPDKATHTAMRGFIWK
ncbi:hypothetical protein, partial [Xanthomonas fragariae]